MQLRAPVHRRMLGMATALLIAATLVSIAGPVLVSAYFVGAVTAHDRR
jgi:hypothetical protein